MSESRTFNAKIKLNKPHFVQKAIVRRVGIKDAYNSRFRTTTTFFMPKLTPEHPKPVIFMHVSNGNGVVMTRFANIAEIERYVDGIQEIIHSDAFYETYNRLDSLSDRLIQNDLLIVDSSLMDVGQLCVSLSQPKK